MKNNFKLLNKEMNFIKATSQWKDIEPIKIHIDGSSSSRDASISTPEPRKNKRETENLGSSLLLSKEYTEKRETDKTKRSNYLKVEDSRRLNAQDP